MPPSPPPPDLGGIAICCLAKVLGCPCCGPEWWAALVIGYSERHGEPIGPELDGWHRKVHPQCFTEPS
jgi:hypothetical protein